MAGRGKRTGLPLSEAELRQRKEAAKRSPHNAGPLAQEVVGPLAAQKKEELMELIKNVMPQHRQGDELLVELLALNLTKIQILEKEFSQRSYFDGGGVTTRMWDIYWNAMRQAIRICSELGLSPTSRNRLGLQVTRQWSIAKELNLIEQEEMENASGEAKALPQ